MYNTDFLPQLERFEYDPLHGGRDSGSERVRRIKCVEDTNGEWVAERTPDGDFVYVDSEEVGVE